MSVNYIRRSTYAFVFIPDRSGPGPLICTPIVLFVVVEGGDKPELTIKTAAPSRFGSEFELIIIDTCGFDADTQQYFIISNASTSKKIQEEKN